MKFFFGKIIFFWWQPINKTITMFSNFCQRWCVWPNYHMRKKNSFHPVLRNSHPDWNMMIFQVFCSYKIIYFFWDIEFTYSSTQNLILHNIVVEYFKILQMVSVKKNENIYFLVFMKFVKTTFFVGSPVIKS